MKKWITAILLSALILSLAACGNSSGAPAVQGGTPAATSAQGESPAATEELYPGGIVDVNGVKAGLPDNSWYCGNGGMMGYGLFKEGHFYKNYPTIRIIMDDTDVAQSMASSNNVYSAADGSEFETTIGGYSFCGNQAVIEGFTKTDSPTVVDRLYYAISDNRTLYIQLYAENGGIKGVGRDDPEAQAIIKSIIELNGFDVSANGASSGDENGAVGGSDMKGAEWSLSGDGVLTIRCVNGIEGHMNSYEYPWDKYADQVTSLVITGTISEIPELAFSDFGKLQEVSLPDSIKTMRVSCFKNCVSLKKVELPASLQEVEYFVFSGCEALEEISVPGTLKHINNYAFSDCTSLKTATIHSGVESLGYDVFDGCTSLTTLYLPKSVRLIDLVSFRDVPLKDVYYEGTIQEFMQIDIKSNGNEPLKEAAIHEHSFNG